MRHIALFHKKTMHDIKTLGNNDLGHYYERVDQNLIDIQIEIVENISDILNKDPPTDAETYTDPERFHDYCTPYRETIEKEKRELFLVLKKEKQGIQEEIKKRQMQMLKEIGIIEPSMRVRMIMEQTRGVYFQMFENMITYIKLAKKGKAHTRPKKKRIQAPPKLTKTFENLGKSILTVLAKNLGPTSN